MGKRRARRQRGKKAERIKALAHDLRVIAAANGMKPEALFNLLVTTVGAPRL